MRLVVLIVIIGSLGCTTKPIENKLSLTYPAISRLKIGLSSPGEIEKIFGNPTSIKESNGQSHYHYSDKVTGDERLVLGFNGSNAALVEILWMPAVTDPEYQLENAKAHFAGAKFREEEGDRDNPHASFESSKLLIDEKNGITIRVSRKVKTVEAIAIYAQGARGLASPGVDRGD